MKKDAKEKRPGNVLWRVLLVLYAVILAAVLELGKHTLPGWALAALLVAGFWLIRAKKLKEAGRGKRFLAWIGLFVLTAGILWISWPPVRPVPAVSAKNPEATGVIRIAQGDLTGVCTEDKAVEVYAGIPYAEPPVGDLRWKEPVPAGKWNGVLRADTFAPMSMQTRNLPIYDSLARIIGYHDYEISLTDNFREPVSEDSLYLNVWKPAGDVKNLPVLVYVHGGSLQTGQPWYRDYSGEGLAREGVVVVNMGYRLGIFGFFADPELAAESPNGTTGNYGLLDQICALEWVRDNIRAFGGDPDNVTIAGESAGSACVTALATSPLAKGLFRRIIAESSTVTAPYPAHSFRLLDEAYEAAERTKEKFRVTSVAKLRQLPAEKIVGELSVHHHLTVDGYALTETPYESYRKGIHNEEAQLHGFNGQEAAPFLLFSQANLKNYKEKITGTFPAPYADRVLELYPASTDAEAKENWAEIFSVVLFSYGHYCWERQAVRNGIPTYVYYFTKQNGYLDDWHSGEEIYFYGNIPAETRVFDDEDRDLSRLMMSAFVNFVKTGDPNGPIVGNPPGEGVLSGWKAGTGGNGVYNFGAAPGFGPAPYRELYDVLDEMYGWK